VQVAQVGGDRHVAHHRAADEGDLAPGLVGGVEHLLDPVDVRGEARDDDPPLGVPEHLVDRRGDVPLGAVKPGTSALVESVRKRSTPSSPSRAKARRSVIRPSRGSWSILKSPVCSRVPAAVRTMTASASGIEWLTATNSRSKAPRPLALALAHGQRVGRDPVLLELGLDQGKGQLRADERDVPLAGQQEGTAPMWSSCPWVRTTASMSSSRPSR
jgi:hypothetical protein